LPDLARRSAPRLANICLAEGMDFLPLDLPLDLDFSDLAFVFWAFSESSPLLECIDKALRWVLVLGTLGNSSIQTMIGPAPRLVAFQTL